MFTKATTSVTGPYDDIDPHHGVTRSWTTRVSWA